MAATFLVFIVPQAISLIRFPGVASEEIVTNVILMSCLCFGACWLGYQRPAVRSWQQKLTTPINLNRLFHGGLVFIAVSYYFNHLISGMTDEQTGGDQWTGTVTIYAFFAGLIYPAFAICLITALRTKGMLAWVATMMAAIPPLEDAVFYGRREGAAHFLMTCGLTLYFERGFKPPRFVVGAFILAAMLFIPVTSQYRSLAHEGDWQEIWKLEMVGNFESYVNQESPILELRNASFVIEGAKIDGYHHGESYWDEMVFRFVPAQLLGKSFKESIMFRPHENKFAGVEKLGYYFPGGTTPTGIGDSFQEFGWFGCIFFAVFGLFFKTLWKIAADKDSIIVRIFYIQVVTTAMLTVTHGTVVSLPDIFYYSIFLGLLFLYARDPGTRARKHRRGGKGGAEDGNPKEQTKS